MELDMATISGIVAGLSIIANAVLGPKYKKYRKIAKNFMEKVNPEINEVKGLVNKALDKAETGYSIEEVKTLLTQANDAIDLVKIKTNEEE